MTARNVALCSLVLSGVAAWIAPVLVGATGGVARPGQERYRGRPIAEVMSYLGAPWLEREDRAREEDPDTLLAALGLELGSVVADLGCGSGYYARRLARAVGDEGRVYCVDIQPEMLEIARRLAAEEGIENLETVLNDAESTGLAEGSVDLVLLVDVYHEFQHPAEMLASLRRALRPQGRVALAEYRLEGPSAAHIKLDHRMSVEQVLDEWLPAGFRLVERIEELPTQHLFLFEKSR